MNDIEAILDAARHMAFQEPQERPILNPLSTLPEPRMHVKEAIKERIRLLVAAYISLATFVEDEKVYYTAEAAHALYIEVLKKMGRSEKEMEDFLHEVANSLSTSGLDARNQGVID